MMTTMQQGQQQLVLKPYQEECLQKAKNENIIVSLPTGKGKTLIAARLIEYCLHHNPDKKVAFLVPTRSLVDQQAKYCHNHCRIGENKNPPNVLKLAAEEQTGWGKSHWEEALENNDIFLGTPAVFGMATVTSKFIDIGQFCLIVFDECHNAKGNSPMATIMKDSVYPYIKNCEGEHPRILGLTASIILGKVDNSMIKKRRQLEELLLSTVYCPTTMTEMVEGEGEAGTPAKTYTRITYDVDVYHESRKSDVEAYLGDALKTIEVAKDVKKAIRRCSHVFCELGYGSMLHYLDHVLVKNIENKLAHLELLEGDENATKTAEKLRKCLPDVRNYIGELARKIRGTLDLPEKCRTNKLSRLLTLLDGNFAQHSCSNGYRGIVFVEQIALVSAMTKSINDHFGDKVLCGAVAGTGAQKQEDRQNKLDGFLEGRIQILVATDALEEGHDIPECQFVIRYNTIKTTKAHIQGSGRARHKNAQLYYFENDPEEEQQKESRMLSVARDSSLSVSEDELKLSVGTKNAFVRGKHPYPFYEVSQGIVNVFNCKDIFVRYCAKVFGAPIEPKSELYDERPPLLHERTWLTAVRYPTPEGWKYVTEEDYKSFWQGVDMKQIFDPERSRGKTVEKREEMCFVYIAVIQLRGQDLLNENNEVNEVYASASRKNCPLRTRMPPDTFTLKNKVFAADDKKKTAGVGPPTTTDRITFTHSKSTEENFEDVTIDNCKQILENYVSFVFDKHVEFIDEIFDYKVENGKLLPSAIRFPTSTGWIRKSTADCDKMRQNIDDPMRPESRLNERKRREIELIYLAVRELEKWDFLDENFQPHITKKARVEARKKCPLREEECQEESSVQGSGPPISTVTVGDASNVSNLDGPVASQQGHIALNNVSVIGNQFEDPS